MDSQQAVAVVKEELSMRISVIIPTYNGAHKVMGVLRSLESQTLLPYEVIVVIDGSTDGTATMLKNEKIQLPNFKIVEQENKGRAAVRNRGAEEANGNLLIFLDDDMIALPELVAAYIDIHKKNNGIIVTGMLIDPNKDSKNDFLRFKSFLNDKWSPKIFDKTLVELGHTYLTAGNLSITKNDFNRLNGFDEKLNDAEDFDLATRAKIFGYRLYYSNAAVAIHNDQENDTCENYIKRLKQYQEANIKLAILKPELYGKATIYTVAKPIGIKKIIFEFFKGKFWINSVDKGWCRIFPKTLRYKLYDIIITANSIADSKIYN